jgi:hypothetical protein
MAVMPGSRAPSVDVVIAVHDASRPVGRAAASALADGVATVRVIVVCHGVRASSFAEFGDVSGAPITWIEYADGIHSPAGPFNYGIGASQADFVTVMGSDDYYEPGAMTVAIDRLGTDDPDALVLPLRHQSGEEVRNPLARRGHVHALDPVRDRMAYRTAPLALIRRSTLDRLALKFTPGLSTGEDIDFSARLWFSDARIDFHPGDPGYVIGADAQDRVTAEPLPARIEVAPVAALLKTKWAHSLGSARRRALAVKVLRIHVLGPLLRRVNATRADLSELQQDLLSEEDAAAYASLASDAVRLAPRTLVPFSRSDRKILDALARPHPNAGEIRLAAVAHAHSAAFDTLVPRNPLAAFDREGNVRRFVRYRTWPNGRSNNPDEEWNV